jgi:hypothetical protein
MWRLAGFSHWSRSPPQLHYLSNRFCWNGNVGRNGIYRSAADLLDNRGTAQQFVIVTPPTWFEHVISWRITIDNLPLASVTEPPSISVDPVRGFFFGHH